MCKHQNKLVQSLQRQKWQPKSYKLCIDISSVPDFLVSLYHSMGNYFDFESPGQVLIVVTVLDQKQA